MSNEVQKQQTVHTIILQAAYPPMDSCRKGTDPSCRLSYATIIMGAGTWGQGGQPPTLEKSGWAWPTLEILTVVCELSGNSLSIKYSGEQLICTVFMVALCNRADHYIFALWFLSSFFFLSSPNLSGRRLDVYHTSAHGVALVRI